MANMIPMFRCKDVYGYHHHTSGLKEGGGYNYTYVNGTAYSGTSLSSGTGSCYTDAGHTHSATSADKAYAGNHDNVKYNGHRCTAFVCGSTNIDYSTGDSASGNYVWEIWRCNTCGWSTQMNHAGSIGGSGTPYGRYYITSCNGRRWSCGSPVNTFSPTKCGYTEGQYINKRFDYP